MKHIYLLAGLFCVCGLLQAQEYRVVNKPSKSERLIQIDTDFGANFDLSYSKKGNALSLLTNRKKVFPTLGVRFQHFVFQKLGWYANLRFGIPGKYEGDSFGELTRELSTDYYVKDFFAEEKQRSGISICGDIGLTYRIEHSRWSCYPRFGIGVNSVSCQSFRVELKKKGSNELYQIRYDSKEYNTDILDILVMSAGLNVNYKLSQNCYLLLSANYLQPIGKNTLYKYVTDLYTQTEVITSSYRNSTIGRDLNVSLGVGIPIRF